MCECSVSILLSSKSIAEFGSKVHQEDNQDKHELLWKEEGKGGNKKLIKQTTISNQSYLYSQTTSFDSFDLMKSNQLSFSIMWVDKVQRGTLIFV